MLPANITRGIYLRRILRGTNRAAVYGKGASISELDNAAFSVRALRLDIASINNDIGLFACDGLYIKCFDCRLTRTIKLKLSVAVKSSHREVIHILEVVPYAMHTRTEVITRDSLEAIQLRIIRRVRTITESRVLSVLTEYTRERTQDTRVPKECCAFILNRVITPIRNIKVARPRGLHI